MKRLHYIWQTRKNGLKNHLNYISLEYGPKMTEIVREIVICKGKAKRKSLWTSSSQLDIDEPNMILLFTIVKSMVRK